MIEIVIAFLIAVYMGIIVTIAATVKNRGGPDWFFYGFLLWPFALPHILLKPALPDRYTTKVCPDCAEAVLKAALVCRHCRHQFEVRSEHAPSGI
jgi:hypothetical protein